MVSSPIVWKNVSEVDFNSIAENLLVRHFSKDGLVAAAVDGRGGDEGIDVELRVKKTGQLIRVFQLKWFPQGFSGGFGARKTQIKASFDRAITAHPKLPRWTLVIPGNGTIPERKYTTLLGQGRWVQTDFMGATELELLLGIYPEIQQYHQGDYHREALEIVGRESAALNRPQDLFAEVQRIQKRTSGRSNYWASEFSASGGITTLSYRALRPDAHVKEPLSVMFEATFHVGDEELHQQFREMLDYGSSKRFELPPHVIRNARNVGPEWFAEDLGRVSVAVLPPEGDSVSDPFLISAQDRNGRALASLRGTLTHVDRGGVGVLYEAAFPGGLMSKWTVPFDRSAAGLLTLSLETANEDPAEAWRSILFVEALALADQLVISLGNARETLALNNSGTDLPPIDPDLRQLVDDLAFLNYEFNVSMLVPKTITRSDRVWVGVARLIQEGKVTSYPDVGSLTFTLSGESITEAERLLTQESVVLLRNEWWQRELLGQTLTFDDIAIFHHKVSATDGEVHAVAVKAGSGAGRRVTLVPVDGTPFRIYSLARLAVDPDMTVHPWGTINISEHPKYDDLRQISSRRNDDRPPNPSTRG